MLFNIILNSNGQMLQNEKCFVRAGLVLALIFLFIGKGVFAQSPVVAKYSFQVTGGYSVSEAWDINGFNVDVSLNRHIWSFISLGLYYDVSGVNNYIPEISQTTGLHDEYFIPPALDHYIKSLTPSQAWSFNQVMDVFRSFGLKTNFDFKLSPKIYLGFYFGIGLTKRSESSLFLSVMIVTNDKVTDYILASQYVYATEMSFRYGLKLTYVLSQRINLVLQSGHNTSKFKKHPFNETTYEKGNVGVVFKF